MSNVIGELDNCKCIKEESEDNKFAEFIESQKELSLTVSVATESIIKFKRALVEAQIEILRTLAKTAEVSKEICERYDIDGEE